MQAGSIIRRVFVYVERDGKSEPLRVYASVVRDGARSYEEVTEVLKDPVSKRQLLDAMRRDLDAGQAWRRQRRIMYMEMNENCKYRIQPSV